MRELAFTGRDMAANEAREIGLVNQVYVDHKSMLAGVMEIARQIAAHSPLAQRGVKEMLNYARDHSVADGLNYIAVWNAAMIEGSEMMEAMAARRGKRAATFNDLLERIDIDPKPKAAAE
jgi:enoyl-CoA hydratase